MFLNSEIELKIAGFTHTHNISKQTFKHFHSNSHNVGNFRLFFFPICMLCEATMWLVQVLQRLII